MDESFRIELSKRPGVPVFYLANNILMLEPPSQASIKFMKKVQFKSFNA